MLHTSFVDFRHSNTRFVIILLLSTHPALVDFMHECFVIITIILLSPAHPAFVGFNFPWPVGYGIVQTLFGNVYSNHHAKK